MLPNEIQSFSKSIASVLGFVSNISFWLEEGYFSINSAFKPLIHTWSLAVEEQFYLLFPLLLLLLKNFDRLKLNIIIIIILFISFGLCEFSAYNFQTANFYLAPTRAWELLSGSVCALIKNSKSTREADWRAALGLILIIIGITFLDGTEPFPSHFALIPVAGSMLIILFCRSDAGVGKLLSSQPFVSIGLISYSLYLWHQPIIAFTRLSLHAPPSPVAMIGIAMLSTALAWASWRYVETPFRKRGGPQEAKRSLLMASAAILSLLAFCAYGVFTDGARGRMHRTNDPSLVAFVSSAKVIDNPGGDCKVGADGQTYPCWAYQVSKPERRVAIFGDSHAMALRPAFAYLAQQRGVSVMFGASAGCPPLFRAYVINGNGDSGSCPMFAERQFSAARSANVDVVYLVGRWTLYTDGDPQFPGPNYLISERPRPFRPTRADSRRAFAVLLKRTISAYGAAGIQVVLVDQVPQQPFQLDRTINWLEFNPPRNGIAAFISESSASAEFNERLHRFSRRQLQDLAGPGVNFLSFDPLFRSRDRFLWGDARSSWYRDSSHLSKLGAERLGARLIQQYDKLRDH